MYMLFHFCFNPFVASGLGERVQKESGDRQTDRQRQRQQADTEREGERDRERRRQRSKGEAMASAFVDPRLLRGTVQLSAGLPSRDARADMHST